MFHSNLQNLEKEDEEFSREMLVNTYPGLIVGDQMRLPVTFDSLTVIVPNSY